MDPGITDAVKVNVSRGNACALREGGSVLCWGALRGAKAKPVLAAALKRRKVNSIAMSDSGVCALDSAGALACDGFSVPSDLPPLAEVSVGDGHVCARGLSGEILCWGKNNESQLGDGTCAQHEKSILVKLPAAAQSVAAGFLHSCALLIDGSLWCWGNARGGAVYDEVPLRLSTPTLRGSTPGKQ